MGMIRPWLARYSWEFVTAQNALLCQAKGALHKATSDGHDQTQRLWKDQHEKLMRLEEAVALCRQCHRLAPFCFYNGNTFAGIIRDVIRELGGHIVAGVSTGEEEKAFREFCESLDGAG